MNTTGTSKPITLRAPWLGTALVSLAALMLFFATGHTAWLSAHNIAVHWLAEPLPALALGAAMLIWVIEKRFFQHRCEKANQQLRDLQQQNEQLKQSKRQLQQKAQRHSSQTDKLKAFIGDRLLEYIEYDEKYLHFKGIAAEVRHNGVISYDKIQRALLFGQQQLPGHSGFEDALINLGYLWDLLDLSTADNMAMHINNHLCDCEEYYYQQQLNPDTTPPFQPTFYAHEAIARALEAHLLGGYCDLNTTSATTQLISDRLLGFIDRRCLLLGNPNHIVLAAENLIKNALYFNESTPCDQLPTPRKIVISLSRSNEQTQLSVYNHGPHIPDEITQQIYQLGFSTRTEDPIHGKGLGLYFVKQIVAGFEGDIKHHNIANRAEQYTLRLELQGAGLEGSEIQTELVEVSCLEGVLSCENKTHVANESSETQLLPAIDWSFRRPLLSIEITAQSNGKTHSFDGLHLPKDSALEFYEPCAKHPPRWKLLLTGNERGHHKLRFEPMDVTGVEFIVQLPLADAAGNLENEYQQDERAEFNRAMSSEEGQAAEAYIESIADRFKPIDQSHNK